jgi:ribonuclease HII
LTKLRNKTRLPKFKEEKLCEEQGYKLVAGIDEVGRGCLAGPVVAAAVIMPHGKLSSWYGQVRDSKLLTPGQREYLSPLIHDVAISIGTGTVYPDTIDTYGMTRAVRLAMKSAVDKLSPQPDFALIDYLTVPDLCLPHKGVENGDTLCFSIACASIVAKVFRDHLMIEFDRRFPGYGFAQNKGYGTEGHMDFLRKLGPSPLHRRSFEPVKNWMQLSFDDLPRVELDLEKNEA